MTVEVESYLFLQFHIKLLTFFHLWPRVGEIKERKWYTISNYSFVFVGLPSIIPLTFDFFTVLTEEDDVSLYMISMLPIACIIGELYMVICFLHNRENIRDLVERLTIFQNYSPLPDIIETDKKAIFISKILLLYSTIGCGIYCFMPLLTLQQCNDNKSKTMLEYDIPCAMVVRSRSPIHISWDHWYKLLYAHQCFYVFTISTIIILLSVFLCGILMHVTHHLKKLRALITQVSECSDEDIEEEVVYCVLYHIEIIEFCKVVNKCFSSQMLMHLTLTSFIISILGYVILFATVMDAIRFTLHLLGWIALLLLVCYYGQTLMDESVGVATDAYTTNWYNSPLRVQKDIKMIIMRAQKPIALSAMGMGFMSFATFLKVLSSAYSYFTLLLNIN